MVRPTGLFPVQLMTSTSGEAFDLTHPPSIQCWAIVVIKDSLSNKDQRACVFSAGASYLR
jgi:hypothetical protein